MYGHLVIADISGYTRFFTENELEHANGIIGELLNGIIAAIQAPMTVSSIEGDAVFIYGVMPEGSDGQTVVESVERLYTTFASALETMVLNTTCTCNACSNIGTLGLKIVMHCGEFVGVEVGGRETLSGSAVIMTHRLLKNTVREKTGIADYLLLTQQCVADLGIERMVAGWTKHTEVYEHVGEVTGYVSSLVDVWEFVRQQTVDKVLERDAWISVGAHSSAPPLIVWDFLIDPFKRTAWIAAEGSEMVGVESGRIGPAAEYHCAHGEGVTSVSTVLDMRHTEYLTLYSTMGEGMVFRFTDYLIPSGGGTKIVTYAGPVLSTETGEPFPQDVLDELAGPVADTYRKSLERLAAMAEEAALASPTV